MLINLFIGKTLLISDWHYLFIPYLSIGIFKCLYPFQKAHFTPYITKLWILHLIHCFWVVSLDLLILKAVSMLWKAKVANNNFGIFFFLLFCSIKICKMLENLELYEMNENKENSQKPHKKCYANIMLFCNLPHVVQNQFKSLCGNLALILQI